MISIKRNVPVVYFISDGQGHCKIGVASDIKNRFNTLQVGSAYELTIEEAQERYEREMPEYWKQYDIQRWENLTGKKAENIKYKCLYSNKG